MQARVIGQGPQVLAANSTELERNRSEYYTKLADHFLRQISLRPVRTMLEAGCGKGQLTIPLTERLPRRIRLIAVDSSSGPYKGSLEILSSKLRLKRCEKRVRLVRSDVKRIRSIPNKSVDVVISNELLCDLKNETQVVKAFKEFRRILRPKGIMIHGEWLSSPANKPQSITIRADSPEGTDSPSRFWNPDEISGLMMSTGFGDVQVSFFDSTLSLEYEAAIKELRSWGVRESFLHRNDKSLRRYGIQLPFEHVIRCQKQAARWTRQTGLSPHVGLRSTSHS